MPEKSPSTHDASAAADETFLIEGVEYTVHPLAAIFPPIEGQDYRAFEEDIKRRGVVSPVLRRGNQLIDGRNRVRAALATGKKIPFVELGSYVHPAAAILTANIHLRVLTSSQRAVLSKKLRDAAPEVFDPDAQLTPPKSGPGAPAPGGEGDPAAAAASPASSSPADGAGGAGQSGKPGPSAAAPATGRKSGASPSVSGASPSGGSAPASGSSAGGKPPSSSSPLVSASGSGSSSPEPAPEVTDHARRKVAGDALAVSPTYQRQAEQVQKDAPELFEAAGQGAVTIRDAYPVRTESPKLRAQALRDVKEGKAKTLVAAVEARTKRAPKAQPPSQRRLPPTADSSGGPALPAMPTLPGDGKSQPASPKTGASGARSAAQPAAPAGDFNPDILTPVFLLAGLRLVLGTVDLDPCSNADAQDRIAAGDWFSAQQDGLKQSWKGVVWAFPPVEMAPSFAVKLLSELRSDSVPRAGFLAPADLTQDWAREAPGAPVVLGPGRAAGARRL